MRRAVSLAFFLVASGCGYWGRRPVDESTTPKPDDRVWIWTKSGVEKWDWVKITRDSVSGVPWEALCACRRSIPRAQVDSMKVGYTTFPQGVMIIVGSLAVAFLVEGAFCSGLGVGCQ